MEEVDKIIIHSLRQIGCEVDEEITSLANFDTELIIKATVSCLDIIKPGLGLSPVLPANMAARFRMGATLAQSCSELGYRGDIGYQTFLYSAEADLRRVFMFLIDRLPKESDKIIAEPITKSAQLEKLISSAILTQISVPWLPHYCHKKRSKFDVRTKRPFSSINLSSEEDVSEDHQTYNVKYKSSLIEQVPQDKLIPTIISLNNKLNKNSLSIAEKIDWLNSKKYSKVIDKSENDSHQLGKRISNINLNNSKTVDEIVEMKETEIKNQNVEEVEEDVKKNEEQEVDKLKNECESLKGLIEEVQIESKKLFSEKNKIIAFEQSETNAIKAYEEESKIKLKAFELLEDGDENIKKLDETIDAYVNKLVNLANQWEKHRSPLIDEYRNEREKYSSKASASQKKLDELKFLRDKERELLEESKSKDQQYSQLVQDVQKLSKDLNRAAYTQRILEIINNVRKQKDEIDKVLRDTREIQKEINTLSGRLERSFAVVDELIFRDARMNETSRRAYKLLATLHSDCSDLVSLVEETGATVREIRDLEEQIDSESSKNIGANLERITADLKQMRQETATLTAQLQSKNS